MGIEQDTHNPHFGWNNPVTTTQLLQIARLSSARDCFRMARHSGITVYLHNHAAILSA
jgi:hypothetical protein